MRFAAQCPFYLVVQDAKQSSHELSERCPTIICLWLPDRGDSERVDSTRSPLGNSVAIRDQDLTSQPAPAVSQTLSAQPDAHGGRQDACYGGIAPPQRVKLVMIFITERLFLIVAAAFAAVAVNAVAQNPVPVTDLSVEGVIVEGGIVCPLLRTNDGLQIALQGVERDRFPAGTCLHAQGRWVRHSNCMQGARTLLVKRILKAECAR